MPIRRYTSGSTFNTDTTEKYVDGVDMTATVYGNARHCVDVDIAAGMEPDLDQFMMTQGFTFLPPENPPDTPVFQLRSPGGTYLPLEIDDQNALTIGGRLAMPRVFGMKFIPQTLVGAGTDISVDDVLGPAIDNSGSEWTLAPENNYLLEATSINANTFSNSTSGVLTLAWVRTDNAATMALPAVIRPTTSTAAAGNNATAAGVVHVGANSMDVKLRCVSATGTATISSLFIKVSRV